jgi:hypothetical protein
MLAKLAVRTLRRHELVRSIGSGIAVQPDVRVHWLPCRSNCPRTIIERLTRSAGPIIPTTPTTETHSLVSSAVLEASFALCGSAIKGNAGARNVIGGPR